MKTTLKFFAAILLILCINNYSLSQGNGSILNYYESMKYYVIIYHPDPINQNDLPYGTAYFDLSPIGSSSLPDISATVNAFQTFGFGLNYYYRNGNWNSNQGNGIFSNPNQNPFFPTYSFLSVIDTNGFYSDVFIKLRNQTKKDLVTVRYSNINVYHNDNNALTPTVQNIQNQGGVLTDVGRFNWQDDNEDLAIMGSGGVVCVYRNRFDGFLDENPWIFNFTSGSQKFKMKQIDDKSSPYIQNDPNNRFDLITTQGSTVKVYFNNNNNGINLNQTQTFDAGFSIKELEVADINDDGYNDIIVAGGNSISTAIAKVYLNLTNGNINTTEVYSTPSGFIPYNGAFLKIAISDINNDGFNDLTFMGFEGNTKVFINTGTGSYFNQTASQSISNLHNFTEITQVKSMDIYNTGGKALIYSLRGGGGAINERDWGIVRLNAVIQDIAPSPPIVKGSVANISGFNRPKILIVSNRETPDFQKYEIYKSNAASGWNFNYFGFTTSNEFIDNTEYVLLNGSGDAPPPNTYYAVKTVDLTNLKSNLSNSLGYRVGIPICPNCADDLGDNLSENNLKSPESEIKAPEEFKVTNFPNPFNPTTKIYFNLPISGNVKIEIYNSAGQLIKELLNEFKYPGNYVTEFNGSDLSTGIYFYKIESGNFVQTKRMVLIK